MQNKLRFAMTVGILAAVSGVAGIATAWEHSNLKALADRQRLQDKVSVAMADGHINAAERSRILADAQRILKPEEYASFEKSLDRLSPPSETVEQPRNFGQRIVANRAPMMTLYWPTSVLPQVKSPREAVQTMIARRSRSTSGPEQAMVANQERILPQATPSIIASKDISPRMAPATIAEAEENAEAPALMPNTAIAGRVAVPEPAPSNAAAGGNNAQTQPSRAAMRVKSVLHDRFSSAKPSDAELPEAPVPETTASGVTYPDESFSGTILTVNGVE
jgi:hypothetical protein